MRTKWLFMPLLVLILGPAANAVPPPPAGPLDELLSAVEALSERVSALESANSVLAVEVAALQSALSDEIVARMAGDSDLEDALAAEISARLAADGDLEDALAAETSARSAADSGLQARIDEESAARIAGDAELQNVTEQNSDTLLHFSRVDDDVYITGANLHVLNGEGRTDVTNGLGNLIIGYNSERPDGLCPTCPDDGEDIRTGSHMLVLGAYSNYSSYGGLVTGYYNGVHAPFAAVTGGTFNLALAQRSSISGGEYNVTEGLMSSITGGFNNYTGANYAWVGGGDSNEATGHLSGIWAGVGVIADEDREYLP